MLEKLFEAIDENVLTADLKESLELQFNEAVNSKAQTLAEEIASEKIDEFTDNMVERVEKLEAEKETAISEAKEAIEAEFAEKEKAILESVENYLDKAIEEFVNESKELLDETAKSAKAEMIIEAVSALTIAASVDIASIVEAKNSEEVETKLAESIAKYDALMEANIALEKENAKMLKIGVMTEMTAGMSMLEVEKFGKLADLVEFSKGDDYVKSLETIKESVLGTEAKEEKALDESTETPAKAKSLAVEARFL